MKSHPTNGHSLITQDDPLLRRFTYVEKLLQHLLQRTPTQAQLRDLVQQQWDAVYQAKFAELDDLRTECVRLLAVLRDKAAASSPVSQEVLNG